MWIRRAELRRILALRRNLETKIVELEAELRSERERHQRREDELLDKVLTAAGRYAMKPEAKPKVQTEGSPRLTLLEQNRLAELRKAAMEEGLPASEADKYFWAQRNGEPYVAPQADDPYVVPIN